MKAKARIQAIFASIFTLLFLSSCASAPLNFKDKNGRFSFQFENQKNISAPKRNYVPTFWHNLDAATSIIRKHYIRPGVDLKQCAGKETVQKINAAPNEQTMADLLNGVLRQCLDRYSFYRTSAEVEREKQNNIGIGAELVKTDDGEIAVSGVIPESPAEFAGLREKDIVKKIDGKFFESADTAMRALQGEIGDAISIEFDRDGKTRIVVFARRPFDAIPVSAYVLSNGIGYLKNNEVSASAAVWISIALDKMAVQSGTGLILDFRNNPGGAEIFSAACIVGLFAADPMYRVATMQDRISENTVWARECKKIFPEWQFGAFARLASEKKLVVLVNKNTASMAELIVANLQQSGAVVVGEKTYGKGSGYTIFNTADDNGLLGELHLITDSVLAGEKKQVIESIGVIPDIEVVSDYEEPAFLSERVPDAERDLALQKALEMLAPKE